MALTRKIAVLAACLTLVGCQLAPKKPIQPEITTAPGKRFFHSCDDLVTAKDDGFQHFQCVDMQHGIWEVLVRKQPKK